ncbi:MAG: hypothetical protein IPL40_13885 [Proteobacteria bacterium]|nr:hypothetical protein [Pseudomonadota bacterium]
MNRAIDLARIRLLAADQDATLAIWDPHRWESTIFELARGQLLALAGAMGVSPAVFAHWRYAPHTIRGLVADKQTGYVLKLDAHRLPVQIALGTTMLRPRRLQEVAEHVYGNRPLEVEQPSSRDDGRFLLVNSPFDMARVQLFQRLCDLRARKRGAFAALPFEALYDLANRAVDYANGDAQRLKLEIMKDPSRYRLAGRETERALEDATSMLQAWGQAGRQRALITNSSWPFVQAAMSDFYGGAWRQLFELVVVEARKPGFFAEGLAPEQLVAGASDRFEPISAEAPLSGPRVYRHGSIGWLARALRIDPTAMLYVGDDLGQDGAAPQRAGLRTVAVVPEIGEDQAWERANRGLLERRATLVETCQKLEHKLGLSRQAQAIRRRGRAGATSRIAIGELPLAAEQPRELGDLRSELRAIDGQLRQTRGPWGPPTQGAPGTPSLLALHAYHHADIVVPNAGALGQFAPRERVQRPTPYLTVAGHHR